MKYKSTLILIFVLIFMLIILHLNPSNVLILKSYHLKVEISKPFDPYENIIGVLGGDINDVIVDSSQVDFTKVGSYPLFYYYNHIVTKVRLQLQDTSDIDIELKEITIDLNNEVKATDLLKDHYNPSWLDISFVDDYLFDQVGDHPVLVRVCRYGKCVILKSVVHVLPEDNIAPIISGVRNLTVLKNSDIDLLSSVSVSDNQDTNPMLTIDSSNLDISTPGSYQVSYIAKDRSNNQTIETCIVSVVENIQIGSMSPSLEKIVYLTFDDGPSSNTAKVLDILDQYDAKATFFVTGENEAYYYLIKEAYNRGHTIGLHTYIHEYDQIYHSTAAYFADLKRIEDLVYHQINLVPKYLRFPGGSSNQVSKQYCLNIMSKLTKEVINRGYQYYDWNEDSEDGSGNLPVSKLIKNATACDDNNIILLFHDANGKENTIKALGPVIEYYQNKGYVFKAIDDSSYVVHHNVVN